MKIDMYIGNLNTTFQQNKISVCGGVGRSLKSIEQFKKSSATCKFRQGAKPKLEFGLANTSVVFGEMIQHGVGIALLNLHFEMIWRPYMYLFNLIYPFQRRTDKIRFKLAHPIDYVVEEKPQRYGLLYPQLQGRICG